MNGLKKKGKSGERGKKKEKTAVSVHTLVHSHVSATVRYEIQCSFFFFFFFFFIHNINLYNNFYLSRINIGNAS